MHHVDSWTLIHFLGWFFITVLLRPRSFKTALSVCILLGLGWEAIEPAFGIKESWLNSLVTDSIANLAGACIGYLAHKRKCR